MKISYKSNNKKYKIQEISITLHQSMKFTISMTKLIKNTVIQSLIQVLLFSDIYKVAIITIKTFC